MMTFTTHLLITLSLAFSTASCNQKKSTLSSASSTIAVRDASKLFELAFEKPSTVVTNTPFKAKVIIKNISSKDLSYSGELNFSTDDPSKKAAVPKAVKLTDKKIKKDSTVEIEVFFTLITTTKKITISVKDSASSLTASTSISVSEAEGSGSAGGGSETDKPNNSSGTSGASGDGTAGDSASSSSGSSATGASGSGASSSGTSGASGSSSSGSSTSGSSSSGSSGSGGSSSAGTSGSSGSGGSPPTQDSIHIDSNNNQYGEVGSDLSLPFTVLVKDTNGDPMANVSVVWNVVSGDGSLAAASSAVTDIDGKNSSGIFTLGSTPGVNSITATIASGTDTVVTFTATGGSSTLKESVSLATSTSSSHYRKTFEDSQNSRQWSFYFDGTGIRYSYSLSQSLWTDAASQALTSYNTDHFDVVYKSPYVFVAIKDGYDIVIRRGLLSASADITFESAITVFDASSFTDEFRIPSITVLGNNSLALASFRNNSAYSYQANVRISTNAYNGALTSWSASSQVGNSLPKPSGLSLMSKDTGSEMMLLTNADSNKVTAYTFDGATWTENLGSIQEWFTIASRDLVLDTLTCIAVSGSEIYVGGRINNTSNQIGIAKWNGYEWTTLGSGVDGELTAIAASGSNVYVSGQFNTAGGVAANYIAKWDGLSWEPLGSGLNGPAISLVLLHNELYAGGDFYEAGGQSANYIAKWDGSSWSPLGDGVNGRIYALATSESDDDIYAGGDFYEAGGQPAYAIARWDGSSWSPLGDGVNGAVYSMIIAPDNALYVGGEFYEAGGQPAYAIAKWDGSNWSALGDGLDSRVLSIAADNSNIYVSGEFSTSGAISLNGAAKWDGSAWSALGNRYGLYAMAATSDGVYGIGNLELAENSSHPFAKWDGSDWQHVPLPGINDTIYDLILIGSDIYAAGDFVYIGEKIVNHVAKWDGLSWSALGLGVNGRIIAMAAIGSDLYVGGGFSEAGGIAVNNIAKWDGTSWSALGSGVQGGSNPIQSLAALGTDLYVGGDFTSAGGIGSTGHIAMWDGSSWSAVGSGMSLGTWDTVSALLAVNTDLYAAGMFTQAGGVNANNIAKWDGSSWSALGSGTDTSIFALTEMGGEIYAGGAFTSAGGNSANRVAMWDGSNWSALGSGFSQGVYSLSTDGTNIFAGGSFGDYIAKWDGSSWSQFNSNIISYARAMLFVGSEMYIGAGDIRKSSNIVALASDFSSFYDPAEDNLHLLYSDENFALRYRTFNGTWSSATNLSLNNEATSGLALCKVEEDFYAFWAKQDNDIQYSLYDGSWSAGSSVVNSSSAVQPTCAASATFPYITVKKENSGSFDAVILNVP